MIAFIDCYCYPFLLFSEWITHQHRDTSASIIGHSPLLSYLAVADGESRARVKFELCQVSLYLWMIMYRFSFANTVSTIPPQKMLQPCGPPPAGEEAQ